MSLLSLLQAPWAIEPEKLAEIQAIYATHCRGDKIDIEAIEARMGRPLSNEKQAYTVREGGIAVLAIDGVLAPKANLFMQISGGMSTQMMQQQIESAGADPRIKGIVLPIDSPGGSVHGTPELAATIREIGAIKPILAVSTANMASAAYWAASAANGIYITGPTVLAGSIGIVATHDYSPRAPGRAVTEVTAGRYKRIASSNEPLSAEGKAYMQAQVDHIYSVFVDTVAQNRGATAEQVLEHMADGRVFVGQQAIDAGLVDGVASVDALVEQLATDPAKFMTRRKAVITKASGPSSKGAGAAPKDKSPSRETKGPSMSTETLTRASFEQEHAALFAQVQSEFVALGCTRERDRIKAVLAVGTNLPGHEALLTGLAFDGKTSAPEAAQAVLVAEGAARAAAIKAHTVDAPPAAPGAAAPPDKSAKSKAEQVAEAKAYAKEKSVDFVAAMKHLGYA
ncbi:S49 family peptidase [soil metagenome]